MSYRYMPNFNFSVDDIYHKLISDMDDTNIAIREYDIHKHTFEVVFDAKRDRDISKFYRPCFITCGLYNGEPYIFLNIVKITGYVICIANCEECEDGFILANYGKINFYFQPHDPMMNGFMFPLYQDTIPFKTASLSSLDMIESYFDRMNIFRTAEEAEKHLKEVIEYNAIDLLERYKENKRRKYKSKEDVSVFNCIIKKDLSGLAYDYAIISIDDCNSLTDISRKGSIAIMISILKKFIESIDEYTVDQCMEIIKKTKDYINAKNKGEFGNMITELSDLKNKIVKASLLKMEKES